MSDSHIINKLTVGAAGPLDEARRIGHNVRGGTATGVSNSGATDKPNEKAIAPTVEK